MLLLRSVMSTSDLYIAGYHSDSADDSIVLGCEAVLVYCVMLR
jgi:hypothetical protein